jgi:hypothetical protein
VVDRRIERGFWDRGRTRDEERQGLRLPPAKKLEWRGTDREFENVVAALA